MKPFQTTIFLLCLLLTATITHAEEEIEPISADLYRADGITIVLPADWKPFSFINEAGERTGYLPELWRAWSKHSEIDVRFEYMDEEKALESMANNATDIQGGLYYTDDHIETLDHAGSVYSTTSLLTILKDGDVDCANVLSAAKVGIVDNLNAIKLAEDLYPSTTIVTYREAQQAIPALLDGTVKGVAVGYPQLAELETQQPVLDKLKICRTLFYHEVYAQVQKGQTELLTLIDEGMSAIPSQEKSEIEKRWFLVGERPKPKWLAASLPAAVTVVLIIGFAVMWVRKRRR